MSRHQDNSPSISFFSFQDIITSVTGIMFLVVLILILLLLTLQNTAPQEREEIRRNEELKSELASLQAEVDAAISSMEGIETRLQELMKLDLAESETRLAVLNADLKRILQDNQLMMRKLDQTRDEMKLLESRQEELRRSITQAKEELNTQIQKDNMLSAKIQELQDQIQSVKKTVRFTWQRSFSKKPLLVECGGDYIRAGTSNAETPLVNMTSSSYKANMDGLVRWLAQYSQAEYYLLLLVKPSAFEYAEELSTRLKLKGYERGREILPNDMVGIFKGE